MTLTSKVVKRDSKIIVLIWEFKSGTHYYFTTFWNSTRPSRQLMQMSCRSERQMLQSIFKYLIGFFIYLWNFFSANYITNYLMLKAASESIKNFFFVPKLLSWKLWKKILLKENNTEIKIASFKHFLKSPKNYSRVQTIACLYECVNNLESIITISWNIKFISAKANKNRNFLIQKPRMFISFERICYTLWRHKFSTLAVPRKILIHNGNPCICYLNIPYLTLPYKFSIPYPNPARASLPQHCGGDTLPHSLTQLLVTRFLILKVT